MSDLEKEDGNDYFDAFEAGDPAKEQQIRESYYSLIDKVNIASDEAGDGTVPLNQLKMLTLEANTIFDDVKRPLEARLDFQLMRTICSLGRRNIEKTQSGSLAFTPGEFAEKLGGIMCQGGDQNALMSIAAWSESGEALAYKSTFGFKPLSGAVEWTPPERVVKERQRPAPEELINVRKVAEKVISSELSEETELEEVIVVRRALIAAFRSNDRNPLTLLEFILDPNSFSKSVENMFHLSFLVRDGHAEISLDEFKVPMITPRTMKQQEAQSAVSKTSQALVDLTVPMYEEAIKLLGITEAMVPTTETRGVKRNRSS